MFLIVFINDNNTDIKMTKMKMNAKIEIIFLK